MAKDAFPESYKDPVYAQLDSATEQKLGLPVGLLSSVRGNGERSNHSATNELGTKSVYQFIPATRKAILDKYGIDVTLSPQNASEGAGLLLKEGLDRNKGDASAAVGEYIGGLDRANWGRQTKAYINRVMVGQTQAKASTLENDFGKWMAANPASPERVSQAPGEQAPAPAKADQLADGFGQWLERNPQSAEQQEPPRMGLIDSVRESITGSQRATPETQTLPEWTAMPELNSLSMASFKTGLGTLLSSPEETVKVIQANAPGVQVRQDEKGNFILRSAQDGKDYAIPPGFSMGDIPRAVGGLAAFTPAGRAATLPGMALAGAATQGAIEAMQLATGGEFNPGDVALAGALPAGVSLVARGVGAVAQPVKQALQRASGRSPLVEEALQRQADDAARTINIKPPAEPSAPPVATAAPVAPAAPMATPMATPELTQTAKKAAGGGMGSEEAKRALAEQAAPDPSVVAAAKRLGIEDHLQPDHVTTNQAYRELAQAVKSIPSSSARTAEIQGLDEVGQRASRLIDEIGGTNDLSALSSTVKAELQGSATKMQDQASKLYETARKMIPEGAEVQASDTVGFLQAEAAKMGGADKLAKVSPVEARLLANLSSEEPVTYAFLDSTRKQIGQALQKASGPFKDSESGLLNKLYSTLSNDQERVAREFGDNAYYTYQAAKYATRLQKGFEDDLTALFGRNLDRSIATPLSGAVRVLAKGDSEALVRLVASVPKDLRQNVVASGLATTFRTAATKGELSFPTYAKWYEGLMRNRQAYTAVMSNLPLSARKQMHALYKVSNAISAASKERITTGRIQAVNEQLKDADTLVARLYEIGKRSAVAVPAEIVSTSVGMPGAGMSAAIASALSKGAKAPAAQAIDQLIVSPEFIQLAKAPAGPAKEAAAKRLSRSQAFRRFVAAAGNPREMTNKERWILQSMQARNTTTERQ